MCFPDFGFSDSNRKLATRGLYIYLYFFPSLRKFTVCVAFGQEVKGPTCCTIVRAKIWLGYCEMGAWSLFFGLWGFFSNLAFSGALAVSACRLFKESIGMK